MPCIIWCSRSPIEVGGSVDDVVSLIVAARAAQSTGHTRPCGSPYGFISVGDRGTNERILMSVDHISSVVPTR